MIADLNVHWDVGEDGMPKSHAHVMLTMRQVDEDGFGPKVRDWIRTEMVERWREYLAGKGPFTIPADLARATLLHDEHRHDWALWLIAAGAPDVNATTGPVFVDGAGAIESARADHGLALVRRSMVERELAEGRLVSPFQHGLTSDLAYYLAYPPGALDHAHVAVFRNWLLDEAAV